jgi:hypothetical protein
MGSRHIISRPIGALGNDVLAWFDIVGEEERSLGFWEKREVSLSGLFFILVLWLLLRLVD